MPGTIKTIAALIVILSAVLWLVGVIVVWLAMVSPHQEYDVAWSFKRHPAFRVAFGYWMIFICFASLSLLTNVGFAMLLYVASGYVTEGMVKTTPGG